MSKISGFARENDKKEFELKVANAMMGSKYKWRTIRSLAKELDASPKIVADVLRTSDKFIKARKPNAQGQVLFTTSNRYKAETPFWGRVLGAGANKLVR